jgi:phospholipase/carboxylesterase
MNKTHTLDVKTFGKPLAEAEKAIIMIHGRGGGAAELVNSLQHHLSLSNMAILAPQATNYTWYPYSFLAPPEQNEPWLSSALELINTATEMVLTGNIPTRNLYFLGFSQGACLMLEYVARYAKAYGGVFAYSGGLIGDKIYSENYKGSFYNTPILLGCSDMDPHIPVQRVYASENVLKNRDAKVHIRIYPGMGHTINDDELELTNNLLSDWDHSKGPILSV